MSKNDFLKYLLSWTETIFFLFIKLSYTIWCFLMFLNISDLLQSEYMFFNFKKNLPMSTNMLIWQYRFAYTSDLFSSFNITASLFVNDLRIWFNPIANLASFEESQARNLLTPQKCRQHRCHGFTSFEKRDITKF